MVAEYGERRMKNTVDNWVDKFKAGRKCALDESCMGYPVDGATPETIAQVNGLIRGNRCVHIEDIVEIVGIGRSTVHRIIHEQLNFRRIYAQ